MNVFEQLKGLISSGLPASATIALTAMVLGNKREIHLRELTGYAGLNYGEVEHAATVFKVKGIGRAKTGVLRIESQDVLDLMDRVQKSGEFLARREARTGGAK
jgi:hypothetical protein